MHFSFDYLDTWITQIAPPTSFNLWFVLSKYSISTVYPPPPKDYPSHFSMSTIQNCKLIWIWFKIMKLELIICISAKPPFDLVQSRSHWEIEIFSKVRYMSYVFLIQVNVLREGRLSLDNGQWIPHSFWMVNRKLLVFSHYDCYGNASFITIIAIALLILIFFKKWLQNILKVHACKPVHFQSYFQNNDELWNNELWFCIKTTPKKYVHYTG